MESITSTDRVLATMEAHTSAAVDKLLRVAALREGTDRMRGRATVGSTTAVVDSAGGLVDVEFDDAVGDLDPEALASEVMRAFRSARDDVASRVNAQVDLARHQPSA